MSLQNNLKLNMNVSFCSNKSGDIKIQWKKTVQIKLGSRFSNTLNCLISDLHILHCLKTDFNPAEWLRLLQTTQEATNILSLNFWCSFILKGSFLWATIYRNCIFFWQKEHFFGNLRNFLVLTHLFAKIKIWIRMK